MKRQEYLGFYLKEKLINKNITQAEVARVLGYTSPQFVSNMERGLCNPPLDALKKLTKLYGISNKEIEEKIIQVLLASYQQELRKKLVGRSS
jgi:transcriptional regulator with XRE-family HTH domain